MAETLLSFGVEKLWNLLTKEFDRFQGFNEQLGVLKRDLNLLRSFLEDADAKKHTSKMVKTCVEEIKEIVFDAEDIIETFLLKKELGQTSGIKKRMRRISCIVVDRMKFGSDIRGISKRISKVILDMQSFGVQQMIVEDRKYSLTLQERQREMRKTFPTKYENDLVGLEENVKKLVGYLVEENNIQVVSITGMGGIGKTTLARQVFNHEMIKNHFNGVAWVCISQEFTRTYVWQAILQQLSSKDNEQIGSSMSEDMIQKKLSRLLETSNSLIVLDDMWKEEDWDRIQPGFPSMKGWKVLLTSRNEKVALRADPSCLTFKPECLTIEESWTLFRRITFPKDTSEYKIDEEMEGMGKKMIKLCGGLPLAVKVLGGLLAAQHTLSEWKRIYENIGSHIVGGACFNDRNLNSVYHILSLSFEELPIYLKQCFLYLAHFPEDYIIDVGKLSYFWEAEGIPRPRYYDGATIRQVADGFIEELVNRNMVISERDASTSRFETCHLHDIMREGCLQKAEEENFLDTIDISTINSTLNSQPPYNSRRLGILTSNNTILMEHIKNPKLRSLLVVKKKFYYKSMWMASDFTRLQFIRVLDLSYVKFKGGVLCSDIGKLIHLRYLNLYMAELSHLPSSMQNLRKLLYLNIRVDARCPIYIPNFLKKMGELTYLYLPWLMHDKTKLELGNLVNLETLQNFSTDKSSEKDLKQMTKLRNLSINVRGEGYIETLSASLSEMNHLEDLTINDCMNDEEGFVLKCIHLIKLSLEIYMPKLPDEQHFPSHLTTISLENCRLEDDPMPILEKLLQLKDVKLSKKSFNGRRMVCSGEGFPKLQELELYGLEECEEWIVEEGFMPLLHSLRILDCPKLKKFPNGGFPQLYKLLLYRLEEWEEWIVEEGSMPLLHNLTIISCPKLKKFPNGGFPQLNRLELKGLEEWEEWIVEEGSLPLLHNLNIISCPKLKKFSNGGFPQLNRLELKGLEKWEEWIVEEDSMPLLHTLTIWTCPKLKELPDGLRFNSLKELRINRKWKKRLSEGGADYYKVQHIPLVEFRKLWLRQLRLHLDFTSFGGARGSKI